MKIGAWDSDSGDVFVIAEAGINHQGEYPMACKLIEAAQDAGADAVKFQWFDTDALIRRRGLAADAVRPYALPAETFVRLADYARRIGIVWLCSVFDQKSAQDYLALDPPAVKIGSGELTAFTLLRTVAAAGKPIILSTGMATMQDVAAAHRILEDAHRYNVALLHCVSAYPTPLDQVNLRAMDALKAFHCPVGWSDHTTSNHAVWAAVARGASIIEKHLTLDRTLPGPDHAASTTPDQFDVMVDHIRRLTRMLGHGRKEPQDCERATMKAIGR